MILKHLIHGTARYAYAATGAGVGLKICISGLLGTFGYSYLTEVYKQELRKDMHVTGKRHGYKEHAKHERIEHP